MKLEDAVEIKELDLVGDYEGNTGDLRDADALLIEAGKAVQKVREMTYWRPTELLPGETKD